MTFLSSSDDNHCSDGLLEVDDNVETILLHMMSLLDGSIQCLDAILLDELVYDANHDALLLLANSDSTIHDVVHDPNIHEEMAFRAILLLLLLSFLSNDDSIPLRGDPQDTPNEVVQRCCTQSDVEVHDEHSVLMQSLLDSHTQSVMSAPHLRCYT